MHFLVLTAVQVGPEIEPDNHRTSMRHLIWSVYPPQCCSYIRVRRPTTVSQGGISVTIRWSAIVKRLSVVLFMFESSVWMSKQVDISSELNRSTYSRHTWDLIEVRYRNLYRLLFILIFRFEWVIMVNCNILIELRFKSCWHLKKKYNNVQCVLFIIAISLFKYISFLLHLNVAAQRFAFHSRKNKLIKHYIRSFKTKRPSECYVDLFITSRTFAIVLGLVHILFDIISFLSAWFHKSPIANKSLATISFSHNMNQPRFFSCIMFAQRNRSLLSALGNWHSLAP